MAFLDRVNKAIIIGQGTKIILDSYNTYAEAQGEIAIAIDTGNLYLADSSYRFQIVPTLNLAVVDDNGDIVTDGGEMLWLY